MSVYQIQSRDELSNAIFTALAGRRRRLALEVVADRRSPIDERELATVLAAREAAVDLVDVSREDRERALALLRHDVLPALEDAQLVERHAEGVSTHDHPAIDRAAVNRIVEADPPDAVVRALADGRRRDACAIVAVAEGPLGARALARRIAAREYDVSPEDVPDSEVEDVLVALHHVHLPTLADAGLVAYDVESGRVTETGGQPLEADVLEPEEPAAVVVGSVA